jgi:hypothetical protein
MPWLSDDGGSSETWVPAMDHTGGWKASQYSPGLGAIILARLREGQTIKEVCADPDMPSQATLHRWRHVHADFGVVYERMVDARAAHRRMMTRLKRERWLEWARIEAKIGRRRTRTWVSGAKCTYETGRAKAFCARVAKGQPVYRVCAEPGMPSCKAVYGWLRRYPEFVAMYVAAKREAIVWLGFRIEMIVDQTLDGPISAAQFRAIKRRAARLEGQIGRLTPKTYR